MPNKPITAFTVRASGGRLQVLITQVNIHISSVANFETVNAIWDTGASGSAITKITAQKLGLKPSGKSQVHTANGIAIQNTYLIDIGLPNKVLIQGITATEVDALSGGCDALIGMDIITMGDFSITNHNGITCMSFRYPSCHEIDYVKNLQLGVVGKKMMISPSTPKNAPCPCGSGKQYKRCCGKAA